MSFYNGCSLLITFIGSKDPLARRGYAYIAALFIIACTRTILDQNHWHVGFVTGMRLRTAIVGVIYRKVRPPFCLLAFARLLLPVFNFRCILLFIISCTIYLILFIYPHMAWQIKQLIHCKVSGLIKIIYLNQLCSTFLKM